MNAFISAVFLSICSQIVYFSVKIKNHKKRTPGISESQANALVSRIGNIEESEAETLAASMIAGLGGGESDAEYRLRKCEDYTELLKMVLKLISILLIIYVFLAKTVHYKIVRQKNNVWKVDTTVWHEKLMNTVPSFIGLL